MTIQLPVQPLPPLSIESMGVAGVAGSNSGVSKTTEESIEKRSIGVYPIEIVSEGYCARVGRC